MSAPRYPRSAARDVWLAAEAGDTRTLTELLQSGADPNVYADARSGTSALHEALLRGNADTAKALLLAGASASAVDRAGNTSLHVLARSAGAEDADLALEILSRAPDAAALIAATNAAGGTALHVAAEEGKSRLISVLAQHGASLLALDSAGHEPLAYARDVDTERLLMTLIVDGVHRSASPPRASTPGCDGQPLGDAPKAERPVVSPLRMNKRGGIVAVAAAPAAAREHASSPRQQEARRLHESLLRAFIAADADGAGAISKRELYRALRAAQLPQLAHDEALALFRQVDTDGDGKLRFDEFARLALAFRPLLESLQTSGKLGDVRGEPAAAASSRAVGPTYGAPDQRCGISAECAVGEDVTRSAHGERGDASARNGDRNGSLPPGKLRTKLRRAFVLFDGDNDHGLSLAELASAFRYCGLPVSSTVLRRMFDEADVDGSGAIEYDEFEHLATRMLRGC